MLESVGYFDENNIVEDIATSVNMAINGWTGVYISSPVCGINLL